MTQTWFINGRHMNINEVKAWRAAQQKEVEPAEDLSEPLTTNPPEEIEEIEVKVEEKVITSELSLKKLQKAYAEKFPDKKLVGKYAKNVEWIASKLNS